MWGLAGMGFKQPRGGKPMAAWAAAAMLGVVVLLGPAVVQAQSTKRISTPLSTSRKTNAPLRFRENRGEADAAVKYVARAEAYSLFFAAAEVDVMLHREAQPAGPLERGKPIVVQAHADVLRMRFANANPPTRIVPVGLAGGMQAAGETKHGAFTGVAYRGVYPGTDILFHGNQRQIAIDLMLSPGADTSGIELEVSGATKISVDAEGNAVLHAGPTSLVLQRPSFYWARADARQPVAGRYEFEGHNRLRIAGGTTESNEPVVID